MINKRFIKSQKLMFLLLLMLLTAAGSRAQSIGPAIFNATGNSFAQDDMIYEWSIGELALVETMINAKGSITNGLLQPVLPTQIITNGFLLFPNNILTANGDGKNDAWFIKDLDRFPDNEVRVFDRAGRLVFTAKNYQNDWTGNLSGFPLNEDTYYYVITLKKDGKDGVVKGFISIINE